MSSNWANGIGSAVYSRSSTPHMNRSGSTLSRRSSKLSFIERTRKRVWELQKQGYKLYYNLTLLQRIIVSALGFAVIIAGILFLIYREQIFLTVMTFAKGWREIRGGWIILWLLTFVVSFPPLIGYSTCVTLGGFVYGFPNGWFIVASASTLGATTAFLLSRSLIRDYVNRLVSNDSRFAALSLVLKHDGLKLLCMIRLSPIPFSLSNGALSTIPTITWQKFMFATALVSPKLLLHVFVGHQLAKLAEGGDEMDTKTRMISYISILIGSVVGISTGWIIYDRTKKRSAELEALERAEAGTAGSDYADDPVLADPDDFMREQDDDISLHGAWDDDYHDDEDATVLRSDQTELEDGSNR